MMHQDTASGHLERSIGNDRLRRALAARLDRAFKQAGLSSARAATALGVSKYHVDYWRQGITVPPLNTCTRLAADLNLDVHWLCTGQSRDA
ncbi:transcriptional regulator with XRE-family HTH domain [Paraburkholderia sp. WC7.3g]|uniref:Helix-turn-helix transcriptional regulator n=1 Tax=Paraburkholderia podalyriae TaxID=1938811 RepID=A0ABR7Q257_9BURK|nr:helix-turn-helix transcriptional regulator [Paraburkholderia podalyriae]